MEIKERIDRVPFAVVQSSLANDPQIIAVFSVNAGFNLAYIASKLDEGAVAVACLPTCLTNLTLMANSIAPERECDVILLSPMLLVKFVD